MDTSLLSSAAVLIGVAGGTISLMDLFLSKPSKQRLADVGMTVYVWLDDHRNVSAYVATMKKLMLMGIPIWGVFFMVYIYGPVFHTAFLGLRHPLYVRLNNAGILVGAIAVYWFLCSRVIAYLKVSKSSGWFSLRLLLTTLLLSVLVIALLGWLGPEFEKTGGSTGHLYMIGFLFMCVAPAMLISVEALFLSLSALALFWGVMSLLAILRVFVLRVVEEHRGPLAAVSALLTAIGLIVKTLIS